MALRACNVSNCFSEVMKWDEAWDLKSVWEKVIPLTVLSFSFAEFLFTLVTVMLLTSSPTSVVFLQNFHWGVCCCLLSFLYLAGFYLLATIFHPLVPRWVSLCVCVCQVFSFNHVCRPGWHSTVMLFWSRLVASGRSIGEIIYICSLYIFQSDSWWF